MLLRAIAIPFVVTGVAVFGAAVTASVYLYRLNQRAKRDRPLEASVPAPSVMQGASPSDAAGERSPNSRDPLRSVERTRDDTVEPDSLEISVKAETRSIFDTAEPDSEVPQSSAGDRESYPVDVDRLGSQWLSRATQTSATPPHRDALAEPVETELPTLELDEFADAPSKRGPDSDWLRNAEAERPEGGQSGNS